MLRQKRCARCWTVKPASAFSKSSTYKTGLHPTCKECRAAKVPSRTVEERFWAKVNKTDGCWLWTGAGNRYGQFFAGHPNGIGAHIYSYTLHYGPLPPDKPCVLHKCDTPRCVRPDHLFAGTDADNAQDRDAKGRAAVLRGASNGMAKLTEVEVMEIKRRIAAGEIARTIAEDNGVSRSTIEAIKAERIWFWVKYQDQPAKIILPRV